MPERHAAAIASAFDRHLASALSGERWTLVGGRTQGKTAAASRFEALRPDLNVVTVGPNDNGPLPKKGAAI